MSRSVVPFYMLTIVGCCPGAHQDELLPWHGSRQAQPARNHYSSGCITHIDHSPCCRQSETLLLEHTTIELLRLRDEALAQGHHEQSRLITTQFRHQVKKDRKDYIQEQLRTFTGHQQNWPAIKSETHFFTALQQARSQQGLTLGIIPKRLRNLLRHRTLET